MNLAAFAPRAKFWPGDPLSRLALLAIVAGFLARIASYAVQPLWFDETFTLVIAAQPDAAAFGEWVLNEIGGPVYYGIAFGWAHLFGAEPLSIRLPSLAAAVAAPLCILGSRVGTARARLLWAALLALWPEGWAQAGYARSYAVLILLMTLQAIAFVEVVERTDRRRAAIWFAWSAVAILTHYHAGLISLVQGLLLVAFRTRPALRCWPAAFVFAPVIAWFGFQAATLLSYARPGSNWYSLIDPQDLPLFVMAALGFGVPSLAVAVDAAVRGIAWLRRRDPLPEERLGTVLVVASAVISLAILAGVGMAVPSFTKRYLMPFVPALMLGVAHWLLGFPRTYFKVSPAAAFGLLAITPLVVMLKALVFEPVSLARQFNTQAASAWIADQGGTDRLVFFWDNPTTQVSSTRHLAEFGAYYLRRAGEDPQVVIPRGATYRADPNRFLARLAGDRGRPAIIWVSDLDTPGTLARKFAPQLGRYNADWRCARFGQGNMAVEACVRRK
jgi:hypothetical protein